MSQSIPISKTKIVIPSRRPEMLSRPRLLESLQSLLDNKLILLSAPAGYGKTSLLIDLASHVEMPVCWLSLDHLERDPQRFMAYLIAAVEYRFPNVGKTSRAQLNKLKSIKDESESLLVTFTNDIFEQVEDDFLLIIDDFHLLDHAPVISMLMNRFLELMVENCHVILSTRTIPSLESVTLMVAREQMEGIDYTDLAFLPREVQALYVQNHHQYLSDELAQKLVDETGGWITGMVLSSLTGASRVSGVNAYKYLGQEVVDQQPQEIRDFLMRTSLAEEFNVEFCNVVLGPLYSGPQNWYEFMGFILEKILFALPLETDGRWIRYHPLFREYLQSRLKQEYPEEVHPILEGMVTLYEKADEWEKAYFTCKQLGDVNVLADMIERSGSPMLRGALVTLENWINSLPPSIAQNHPGMISLRSPLLLAKGDLQGAYVLADKAITLYRENQNNQGLVKALNRRANALRVMGNYSDSLADVNESLALGESDMSIQNHYAEALRIKGMNLYRLGNAIQALEAMKHSLALYTEVKDYTRIPVVLMETGLVQTAVGDIEAALNSYQRALSLKDAEGDLFTQAEILNNLAVDYHHIGKYENATDAFEMGLTYARKGHNVHAEALILLGMGDLYCEVEELDVADQAYRQAEILNGAQGGTFISNYLMIARLNLLLARSEFDDAQSLIDDFSAIFDGNESTYEKNLWYLHVGRFYLCKEMAGEAISYFIKCKQNYAQNVRNLELMWSMIWLTSAYLQAGEIEKAHQEVRELIAIGDTFSHARSVVIRQAFSWLKRLKNDKSISRQMRSLIEKAQKFDDQLPAIRRKLRHYAEVFQVPSATLAIHAMGNPEVSIHGRIIPMSEWRTQSVRDLFFFFLYTQEAATKEKIGAALWPDIPDSDTLKKRFKNEIYRLRRAVGRDVIVFEGEHYRFNPQLDYEYDVDAFDAHIQRARNTLPIPVRIEQLQKAVNLVRGSYLADLDTEWPIPERERIGLTYGSTLEELAYLYVNNNQPGECLAICKLGLKHNPFNETMYQIQMRAFAAMGDRHAIKRCYQACKSAMESMGFPVSGETENLYRELGNSSLDR